MYLEKQVPIAKRSRRAYNILVLFSINFSLITFVSRSMFIQMSAHIFSYYVDVTSASMKTAENVHYFSRPDSIRRC